MATDPERTYLDMWNGRVHEWNLAANETGDWLILPRHNEKSVHISGTFGGATVTMEGRNKVSDATKKFQLRDPTSTVISITSENGVAILEAVYAVRPVVTGGDGTTALNIALMTRN